MALIIVAALLGLLGPYPLSWATGASDDGLVQVEYQRFAHLEADDSITVVIRPAAVPGDSVDVEIAENWVRSVDVSGIPTEPQEQVATAFGVRLAVAAAPVAEVTVQIVFRASGVGPVDAGVRVEGRTVPFQQCVLP